MDTTEAKDFLVLVARKQKRTVHDKVEEAASLLGVSLLRREVRFKPRRTRFFRPEPGEYACWTHDAHCGSTVVSGARNQGNAGLARIVLVAAGFGEV